MTITQDRLRMAFPEDEVSTAVPATLPSGITNEDARRLLTEVGLPEDVAGCIFFEAIGDRIRTLADQRQPESIPDAIGAYYIVAITDYHTICFDGATGQCFFVADDAADITMAATTLSGFLEFMCQLNLELSNLDANLTDTELDGIIDRLVGQFSQTDPEALKQSESQWKTLIGRCVGEVML